VTSPALRRLGLGIATLCGARRGWFLPHRHADAAIPPPIYPALEPLFAAAVPDMRALLAAAGGFMDACDATLAPHVIPVFRDLAGSDRAAAAADAMPKSRLVNGFVCKV
jgi:hypothetical protein